MRSRIKSRAERVVVRSGLARLLRRRRRHRGLVLAYHGIVPSGAPTVGEQPLHLPEADFTAQLEVLGELAKVVPLRELLAPTVEGSAVPRVAITWDDAYTGALTCGIEGLCRRAMPATIFVAPGRLGGQSFWWDRIAERFHGSIPESIRTRALQELGGDEERIAATYRDDALEVELPAFARSAGHALLEHVARRPGITVASHSWSHVNLAAVTADRIEQELTQSAHWLSQRFTSWEPLLAYPYGRHSPLVQREAARAGYAAAFRIEGGWLAPNGGDRLLLPRLNVPAGLSLDGFVLRLSGLLTR